VNAFSYGLQAALRRAGAFDLHAAGVVSSQSGNGALLVGTSGSGKSTLTLSLAQCGWRYLSDDMILLNESETRIEAERFRRWFAVSDAFVAANGWPQLREALAGPVASDPTKQRLDPETILPPAIERCAPTALFFPEVKSAPCTVIDSLSPRSAMLQLMRVCPWATYDSVTAPEYLRVLAKLANQCRSYSLQLGRDLFSEPLRSAELLQSYV
jgi:hypothetical protein